MYSIISIDCENQCELELVRGNFQTHCVYSNRVEIDQKGCRAVFSESRVIREIGEFITKVVGIVIEKK